MITNGWVDWAERLDGPAAKQYKTPNAGLGIACHSMEGWWDGSRAELFNSAREASWMFSNLRDGRLLQHYPVTASVWTSGNMKANTTLWSVESEGVAGTPLSAVQRRNMLRLAAEFEEHTGRIASREEGARTIWQHNEVWDWATPNAGPTACPSGRYDGFFADLAEAHQPRKETQLMPEKTLTADEVRAIVREELDARKFEANLAVALTNRIDAIHDAAAGVDNFGEFRLALAAATDLAILPPEADAD